MREVIRIAKPLMLPAIFYQVQGVVTVFIVSLFGTANMVAEVGAFGRLAMALVVGRPGGEHPAVPGHRPGMTGPRFVRVLAQVHGLYLLAMACTLLDLAVVPAVLDPAVGRAVPQHDRWSG